MIQEQNSIPGLTNRFLARHARRIYLGFEKASEYFGNHRGLVVDGKPASRGDRARPDRLDASRGVRPRGTGPRAPRFRRKPGSAHAQSCRGRVSSRSPRHAGDHPDGGAGLRMDAGEARGAERAASACRPYFDAMHRAYAAATVCLARAGALTRVGARRGGGSFDSRAVSARRGRPSVIQRLVPRGSGRGDRHTGFGPEQGHARFRPRSASRGSGEARRDETRARSGRAEGRRRRSSPDDVLAVASAGRRRGGMKRERPHGAQERTGEKRRCSGKRGIFISSGSEGSG